MSEHTIHVKSTISTVREALLRLPQEARGGSPAAEVMLKRVGAVIFGHIREAFIIKSRGGTDEAGDRWAPLSPVTILARLRKRGDIPSQTKQAPLQGKSRLHGKIGRVARPNQSRQGITTSQESRWQEVYQQGLSLFNGDRGNAARHAWSILRREGAELELNKYGAYSVDILRDTGKLLESLSPNSESEDQIFHVEHGEVIIGTRREGASAHHAGDPSRRLPQRRLWPEVNRWPSSWREDMAKQIQSGLVEIAKELVQEL